MKLDIPLAHAQLIGGSVPRGQVLSQPLGAAHTIKFTFSTSGLSGLPHLPQLLHTWMSVEPHLLSC